MKSKKLYLFASVTAAVLALAVVYTLYTLWLSETERRSHITVGFIYDGDGSTPYTENFMNAAKQLDVTYEDKVTVIERFNVPYDGSVEVLDELVSKGCDLIVTNSYGYGEYVKEFAGSHPDIQFCQATGDNANSGSVVKNYHTFMGAIYQGRYLCGMAAGMKLRQMIDEGVISGNEALVGYVAAYPYAEVISGYTAFFLGVRSQCSSAVLKVKYANSWSSYAAEKRLAEQLINEGCVLISQHSDTVGPAVACENADKPYPVYHVGYNRDMLEVAPMTSLTSCHIDWAPYITAAVKAMLQDKEIEDVVKGSIHGLDAGGGIKEGWVKLLPLNEAICTKEMISAISEAEEDMASGNIHVFKGDYIGVDVDDPSKTYDLNREYIENENASAPSFRYILRDVIVIEEDTDSGKK